MRVPVAGDLLARADPNIVLLLNLVETPRQRDGAARSADHAVMQAERHPANQHDPTGY